MFNNDLVLSSAHQTIVKMAVFASHRQQVLLAIKVKDVFVSLGLLEKHVLHLQLLVQKILAENHPILTFQSLSVRMTHLGALVIHAIAKLKLPVILEDIVKKRYLSEYSIFIPSLCILEKKFTNLLCGFLCHELFFVIQVSACSQNECDNRGECLDNPGKFGGYLCDCQPGFHGLRCKSSNVSILKEKKTIFRQYFFLIFLPLQ